MSHGCTTYSRGSLVVWAFWALAVLNGRYSYRGDYSPSGMSVLSLSWLTAQQNHVVAVCSSIPHTFLLPSYPLRLRCIPSILCLVDAIAPFLNLSLLPSLLYRSGPPLVFRPLLRQDDYSRAARTKGRAHACRQKDYGRFRLVKYFHGQPNASHSSRRRSASFVSLRLKI